MRPVLEGVLHYDKLKDGSITLNDIARMNEALDVKNENQRLMK